jgi:hypothetical protein
LIDDEVPTTSFIPIPMKPVLQATTLGVEKKISGLLISAAMQRVSMDTISCILNVEMTNNSSQPISGFIMKFNQNYLGL